MNATHESHWSSHTRARACVVGLAVLFMTASAMQPALAQDAAQNATANKVAAESDLATVYNYVKVSESLATSGQIAYDQIESLRDAGYELVVNLAPASAGANELEGFLVVEAGLSYVHIPVDWREPSMRDLDMFYRVMEANKDRKVYVHCFANMRASAFTYLYRTLVAGVDDETALADMHAVSDPMELEQWAGLIKRAQASHK